ncbi:4-oxalocrotonate tautomerase family protein [Bradyrhizobium sp. WSM 1704]|uniref:tautomerase family protein n=1 Tax=Bradyrhizobium semiaridum TaxID=2821404 RepID=UPI001CE2F18C|nr:4-oxalocrotonate tautomerase family protein [Bradyrhizobium semiaridum]MCA6125406.1 4-oxalocrotonate tautomerase family protein [Bradyrhizobium semiaridum]
MPGIKLTVSGTPDEALSRRLAAELTAFTCTTLRKQPERTMVQVHYLAHEHWFIEARSLAEHGKNSFRLEVTITEGTNTRDEKSIYQQKAFALLSELIGNLHPHSNIHIIDCGAVSYGYGGLSQEYRYNHEAA